jgi:hypothetical protein
MKHIKLFEDFEYDEENQNKEESSEYSDFDYEKDYFDYEEELKNEEVHESKKKSKFDFF